MYTTQPNISIYNPIKLKYPNFFPIQQIIRSHTLLKMTTRQATKQATRQPAPAKQTTSTILKLTTPHKLEQYLERQPWTIKTHRITTNFRVGHFPRWYALDMIVHAHEPIDTFLEHLSTSHRCWIRSITTLDESATRKAFRIHFKSSAVYPIFHSKFLNW